MTIELKSTPQANLVIDGKPSGTTPKKLTRPRGSQPLTIRFERRGSRPVERTITPDRDQLIDVALSPARSSSRPRKPKPAKPKYPF